MPSYASVAASNVPPQDEWPQPDPSLLNTTPSTGSDVVEDSSKISIVASDYKAHPHTTYELSTHENASSEDSDELPVGVPRVPIRKSNHRRPIEAPKSLWEQSREYLLRPGVAGGLIGIVNVGLLGGVGYSFYSKPWMRRDAAVIAAVAASGLTVLAGEGYLAGQYAETADGQRKIRRAKDKGSALAVWIDTLVHKPTTLHVLATAVNATVAGTVGYVAYRNWDRPWNHRTVSVVTIGLLGLAHVDGWLVQSCR